MELFATLFFPTIPLLIAYTNKALPSNDNTFSLDVLCLIENTISLSSIDNVSTFAESAVLTSSKISL
jgi:hypothetical protein